MTDDTLLQAELDAWHLVCAAARDAGIPESDLQALASLDDTPGQRLFAAVRAWGEAYYLARRSRAGAVGGRKKGATKRRGSSDYYRELGARARKGAK